MERIAADMSTRAKASIFLETMMAAQTFRFLIVAALLASLMFPGTSPAAEKKPVRVGLVSFLSGPGAGPFGVPAKLAAEAIVESLNAGKAPPPYGSKGFGGNPIELVVIDEAGGATKQVSEFRNLVDRQHVDVVIGYISSGNCLAIAPIAEEMKMLTIVSECGTPRLFEDKSYKYVFRTRGHATVDAVAAALYLVENRPAIHSFAGMNQNYAWGQDAWNDFEAIMKVLRPEAKVTTSQMPKLGAGQYGAEISALLQSKSEVIHSSFWGGDLEAFMLQATPRDLFKQSQLILISGEPSLPRLVGSIPDGTIVGARGPHGAFAMDSPLNRWLRDAYKEKTGIIPTYPAYTMAQAFLGLKAAYEKAMRARPAQPAGANSTAKAEGDNANATPPSQDEIIAAFEGISFESPSGLVQMKLGKGHQAVQGTAVGTTRTENGQIKIGNVKYYAADRVHPPEGTTSIDWIKGGMKPAR